MSEDINADLSAAFDAQVEPKAELKPEPKEPAPDEPVAHDEPPADEPEAEDEPPADEPKPEDRQPLRAPEGLKPEFKVRFGELDPEWQQEILRREQEAARGIGELSEKAKVAKELDRVIAPYEPMIQLIGTSKTELVQNFMQTAYVLNQGTDEQKAAVVRGIIEQYRIDMPAANDEPASPEVTALKREIAELKGMVQGVKQQDDGITKQQAANDVQAFAADPENEFFTDVKADMGLLIKAGRAQDLKEAYQMACRLNPEVARAIQLREANAKTLEKAREAKAAKASAKQVTGSGPTEEVKKIHDDPRDDVRALLEKQFG